jgi:hypothetical protein
MVCNGHACTTSRRDKAWATFICSCFILLLHRTVSPAARPEGKVGIDETASSAALLLACLLACLLAGMREVTWAALLYGCMSSSLAEEEGLPFCPADVREQLGDIIYKQVCVNVE